MLVGLLLLSSSLLLMLVLCGFFSRYGLQCVDVVFIDHTPLRFS